MGTSDFQLFPDIEAPVGVEGDLQSVDGLSALLAVRGLGPKRVLQLAKRVGSLERLSRFSEHELASMVGRDAAAELLANGLDAHPAVVPQDCSVVGYFDPEYPATLRWIPDPPPILWIRGLLPKRCGVAVVGTRKPTEWSARTARLVAESAVAHETPVVSGLALGTDATAHEACLDAGGITVAVLGSGVDKVSPAANRGLAERILGGGGCILTEQAPGTTPSAHSLVARDRLQSGLCLATFVIQSGIPGGTLHTARFTIEQDRLLVVALPRRSAGASPDPYAGNVALTDEDGCDPAVLHAAGSLAARIAARRPVADLTISREADLPAVWERIEKFRAQSPASQSV